MQEPGIGGFFRKSVVREWLAVAVVAVCAATSAVYAGVQMFDPQRLAELMYDDVADYVAMSRGETPTGIRAFRPMVPYAARLVPDLPSTWFSSLRKPNHEHHVAIRFAVVNWLFLIAAGASLHLFQRRLGLDIPASLVGLGLFVTSTTVVRNAGLPMAEMGFAFWFLAVLLAVQSRSWLAVLLTGLIGVTAKELVLLAAPLALLVPNTPWRTRCAMAAALIPAAGLYALLRQVLPTSTVDDGYVTLSVIQVFDDQIARLMRPNGWINLWMAFGPAWIAAAYGLLRPDCPRLLRAWSPLIGLVIAGVLLGSGNLARSTFTAFPVVIPAAAWGLQALWQHTPAEVLPMDAASRATPTHDSPTYDSTTHDSAG
jgi:hypothetical protein